MAAALAANIGAEIISADSRQVYRRMDIGTGKDLEDYVVNGTPVPYHLVDICEPGTRYNLFQYQKDFIDAYDDIGKRGKRVVLCGGTGLYIEAVLKGYQLSPVPQNDELRERLAGKDLDELPAILADLKQRNHSNMHNRTDVDSPQRAIRAIEIEEYNLKTPVADRYVPPVPSLVVGVDISRQALEVARSQDFPLPPGAQAPVFIQADILDTAQPFPFGPFDWVLSNPPYIMEAEKAQMRRNVLDFEPSAALFVPDTDPLVFYRAVAAWCGRLLVPGGRGLVEINESLGVDTAEVFASAGFGDVRQMKDFFDKDRFVSFRKPPF